MKNRKPHAKGAKAAKKKREFDADDLARQSRNRNGRITTEYSRYAEAGTETPSISFPSIQRISWLWPFFIAHLTGRVEQPTRMLSENVAKRTKFFRIAVQMNADGKNSTVVRVWQGAS
jgi:hypothetical protein